MNSNYAKYDQWYNKHYTHNYGKNDSISQTRGLGGTYGSCWDDEIRYSAPDDHPGPWTELFSLVLDINPDISFKEYVENVVPLIVYTTKDDRDYYGGMICSDVATVNIFELWCAISPENKG